MWCHTRIWLVPRRDNVVDLHEYRRRHARKVIEGMARRMDERMVAAQAEPQPPADVEPEPAA